MVRRRRRKKSGGWGATVIFGAFIAAAVVTWLVDQIAQHLTALAFACGIALVVSVMFALVRSRRLRASRFRQAEQDREISITDGMTGREFEEWVARLLERSGCREVLVVGSSGDKGADIRALTSTGRLLIVQCKRYGE